MVYCAHCGTEISEEAIACPKCGHPNEARARRAVAGGAGAPVVVGEYAGFWIRFVAALLDGLLLSAVSLFVPPLGFFGFVYHWLMIGLNKGQTLGKMALGIRITRPDGSPVDLGRAAGRAAMAIVSGLVLLLGYLWAAWDPERRTWHDMVADTRAYRTPR